MTVILHSIGLDLGDAESAVAVCSVDSPLPPAVFGDTTIPTVVERSRRDGRGIVTRIGLDAVVSAEARSPAVSFKEAPSTSGRRWLDEHGMLLLDFAEELVGRATTDAGADIGRSRLIVGCPSSWSQADVANYRKLFAASPRLPSDVVVVPESRCALVQSWRSEPELRAKLSITPVVIIDIGSSTLDITLLSAAGADELPVSRPVGLFDVDEAILEDLLASDDSLGLAARFAKHPSERDLALLLCRFRKEQAHGRPESPDLEQLLADHEAAGGWWQRIRHLPVAEAVGNLGDEDSWLARFDAAVAEAAAHCRLTWPLVLVTGGGAGIPAAVERVRVRFHGCDVRVGQEPHFAVARGLSEYGRLQYNSERFIDTTLALLANDRNNASLTDVYSDFYPRLAAFHLKYSVEGIWRPVSRLWADGELRRQRKKHDGFQALAMALFREWLDGEGQDMYGPLMDELNRDVGVVVQRAIDEALQSLPVEVGRFSLDVQLPLLELFQPRSVGGAVLSDAAWGLQGTALGAYDLSPRPVRRALGGRVRNGLLAWETVIKSTGGRVTKAYARARINHNPEFRTQIAQLMDCYVTDAVRSALRDSLPEIRMLLLKAHLS